MKKWLLWWKKRAGKDLCWYVGIISGILTLAYAFTAFFELMLGSSFGCFLALAALLLGFVTWFTCAAALTKEDPISESPVPRYFTRDKQGRPAVVEIGNSPTTNPQIEIQFSGEKEAQDTLGMIETLYRLDSISKKDYTRAKTQLIDYLNTTEEENPKSLAVNAQSVRDRFCQLLELYDEKLITEEEYTEKKKQLLDEL